MFEKLYKDPATITRHRSAPLPDERERYLRALSVSGAAVGTMRRAACAQLALVDLLDLADADIPVRPAAMETAVREGCRALSAGSAATFRRHAFR